MCRILTASSPLITYFVSCSCFYYRSRILQQFNKGQYNWVSARVFIQTALQNSIPLFRLYFISFSHLGRIFLLSSLLDRP